MESQLEHVPGMQNELGECPIWNSEEQALYWVNIKSHITAHQYIKKGRYYSWLNL